MSHKIKVQQKGHVQINIAEDILNVAHYHMSRIREKQSEKSNDRIALDCTTVIIFMAFYVEACVNFAGHNVFPHDWQEKAPFNAKLTKLLGFSGYRIGEQDAETLSRVREFRNWFAHGKPEHYSLDRHVEIDPAKFQDHDIRGSWQAYSEPEFAGLAFETLRRVMEHLLDACGISRYEQLTHATYDTTVMP